MRPFRVPTRRPTSPRPVLCEMLEPRLLLDAAAFPDPPVPLGSVPGGGSLSGTLWNDYDGDGVRDAGDHGMTGWAVFLDSNRNDQFDDGEPFALSGSEGGYRFDDLPAGDYQVGMVVPEGWVQTAPAERLYVLYQTRPWGTNNGTNQAQLAQVRPTLVKRAMPAPVGSVDDPRVASNYKPAPQGLAVGASSLFYVDGTVQPQVLWELGLGPASGPTLTDPLVLDSDALDLDEPAGGLAYLNGLLYVTLPASNRIAVFDPVADTIVRTMQIDADIADGLTGAGDAGVLWAATPSTATEPGDRSFLIVDPNEGTILQQFPCDDPDEQYFDGWLMPPIQSVGYYGSRGVWTDGFTAYNFIDPATGAVQAVSNGDLGYVTTTANAIGGDGARRFGRAQICEDSHPVLDFGARPPTTPWPTGVDLLPDSDTGLSDGDDITSLNNAGPQDTLQFRVDGTVPGATVELYACTTLIGSAVAEGTSTIITTDGTTPILGGQLLDLGVDIRAFQTQAYWRRSSEAWIRIEVDQLAPIVKSLRLDDGTRQRSVVRSLLLTLSEAVLLAPGAFEVLNQTTGRVVAPEEIVAQYAPLQVGSSQPYNVTLTFPGLPGQKLPDGRYTLRVKSAQVIDPIGRPLSSSTDPGVGAVDYVYSFHVLAGDFNGDATVDLADLAILASRWNLSGTISQGDASADGKIDLADLAILAANWNVTLPEPAAAASRATRPAARPAATVANPTPAPRVAARRTNGLIDERPVDLLVPVVPRVR